MQYSIKETNRELSFSRSLLSFSPSPDGQRGRWDGSHGVADGRTKAIVAPKRCQHFVLFSCRRNTHYQSSDKTLSRQSPVSTPRSLPPTLSSPRPLSSARRQHHSLSLPWRPPSGDLLPMVAPAPYRFPVPPRRAPPSTRASHGGSDGGHGESSGSDGGHGRSGEVGLLLLLLFIDLGVRVPASSL